MAGGTDQGENVQRQSALRQPLRRRRVHGEEDVADQGAVSAGESLLNLVGFARQYYECLF